ncbi:hypothetical protein BS50DRAFT_479228 [Corynespora cassiicola Philippines]|uniref:Roadblock/LAMTOR2 domain-containing protein n=1 Tax=Corynespora cassiicola Philippines TaxID=1448308 RepID=A0A2T2PD46_CORCC|nr:hypothetical protein BS50DRAFT_479228 [Corynespora cassiicola Philippines]
MLNALKLSELLAKNADPQLYPRIFIMSPNGTLMAYSTPVDIKDLRDQAALISMAWKEHEAGRQSSESGEPQTALETLTIEFQQNNIIVRAIQPSLLLVLVGGVPPSRGSVFKITTEGHGDPRYPPLPDHVPESGPPAITSAKDHAAESTLRVEESSGPKKKPSSIMSTMSVRDKDIQLGVLHIQRKKIDALTDYIRADFNSRGFVMPDDSSFP